MTARTAARLAWSLCAGCVAGIGGLLVLKVLNGPADLRSAPLVAAPLAFSVVGALVAARQQRNPVGWQLLAVGVFGTASLLGESYARYALITAPGSLPGGLYGTWLGWTYAPIVAILAIFLPLYFPTGRLLSPRWRPVLCCPPSPTNWLRASLACCARSSFPWCRSVSASRSCVTGCMRSTGSSTAPWSTACSP